MSDIDKMAREYAETQAIGCEFPITAIRYAFALRNAHKAGALAMLPSSAISDVIAERVRQREVEGWTPEHDDKHRHAELLDAATCYVTSVAGGLKLRADGAPNRWPWRREWWKPKDPRRDLVRAAALILAEIERLDRALPPTKGTP